MTSSTSTSPSLRHRHLPASRSLQISVPTPSWPSILPAQHLMAAAASAPRCVLPDVHVEVFGSNSTVRHEPLAALTELLRRLCSELLSAAHCRTAASEGLETSVPQHRAQGGVAEKPCCCRVYSTACNAALRTLTSASRTTAPAATTLTRLRGCACWTHQRWSVDGVILPASATTATAGEQ